MSLEQTTLGPCFTAPETTRDGISEAKGTLSEIWDHNAYDR